MQLSLLEPQNYSVSVCGWPNVSGGLSCGPWPHLQKPQAGAVSLPVEGVVAPEVPGSKKKINKLVITSWNTDNYRVSRPLLRPLCCIWIQSPRRCLIHHELHSERWVMISTQRSPKLQTSCWLLCSFLICSVEFNKATFCIFSLWIWCACVWWAAALWFAAPPHPPLLNWTSCLAALLPAASKIALPLSHYMFTTAAPGEPTRCEKSRWSVSAVMAHYPSFLLPWL